MKFSKLYAGALALLFVAGLAVLFLGCDVVTDNGGSSTKTLTATVGTGTTYWDLDTGTQVTDAAEIASQKWDIAFGAGTGTTPAVSYRSVFTNSGYTATAAGSGGAGGVSYTGSTDFDGVAGASAAPFDTTYPYVTDTRVFTTSTSGSTAAVSGETNRTIVVNTLNFAGYTSGTGTDADPFVGLVYAQNQYYGQYTVVGGVGTLPLNNRVYILKHGNGTTYSKISIRELELNTGLSVTTFKVTYKTF